MFQLRLAETAEGEGILFESRLLSRWARLEPGERRVIPPLAPPHTLAGPNKCEKWGGNDLEEDRAYWKLMEWESPWLPRGGRKHAPHQRQAGEGNYILEHIPVFLMMASSFSHIGTHCFFKKMSTYWAINVNIAKGFPHMRSLSSEQLYEIRIIMTPIHEDYTWGNQGSIY